MKVAEVCYALGVTPATLRTLKAKGVLAAYKGDSGWRIMKGYDARQVQAVLETHVSLSELAASIVPKACTKFVRRLLEDVGIEPAIDAPEPLWLRTTAEDAVRAWDAERHGVGSGLA